jgi:hypothetical protein
MLRYFLLFTLLASFFTSTKVVSSQSILQKPERQNNYNRGNINSWRIVEREYTRNTLVECQTSLRLKDGAILTYNISGQISVDSNNQFIKDSREGNLNITILRREPNGGERYLRYPEKLYSWFDTAPDADYRPLLKRFSSSFRSNIKELYYVSSADNGIYIGLTSTDTTNIQIVHFLNKSGTRNARSSISRCSVAQG